MAEDLISSIFDEAAIQKQIANTNKELDDLATRLKSFPTLNIGGGVSSLKELTAQNKAYSESLKGISASTKVVLDSERLAALERKKIAQERTDQAKLATAELKLQQVEIKKNAIAEKEAAAISKAAANDAVNAGKERILQLKAEVEAEERLAAAALARENAEQQALSGTFNPGTEPTKKIDATTPAKLTVAQGDIVLLKTYEAEVAKLNTEITKSKAAFQAGEISLASYQKTAAINTEKINGLKNNISSLNREMKLSAAVNDAERNSLARAQALINQYTFSKTKLNLATVEGVRLNDNYNKAISKSNEFIKKNADVEVARIKNIGNYGTAINKILGPIRTLANILPGIGLSGLFLLAFEAITAVVEKLGLFNSKLSETAEKQKLIGEVTAEANKNVGKEITTLKLLYDATQNVSLSVSERTKAAKELQETYPETFKNFSTEQILLGAAKVGYDELTKSVLKSSLARAAKGKLDALSTEELDIQEKKQVALNNLQDKAVKKLSTYFRQLRAGGGEAIPGSRDANIKLISNLLIKERKTVTDENDKLQKDIEKRRKILTDLVGIDSLVDVSVDLKKPPKEKVGPKATLDSTKAQLDSEFEIYKIAQQRKIKLLEDGVNDETKTFDERIALLQQFSTESLKLNDAQTANDQESLQRQLSAQQANLKKVKGTERNNLVIEIANTQTKIKTLDAKNFDERLKIFEANQKKFTEVEKNALDQEEKLRKEQYEKDLQEAEGNAGEVKAALTRQYERRIQVLNENFLKEKITKAEFDKQRQKLDFDFQTQSIRNEIAYAKKILEIQRSYGIDTTKQQEAIAKLASDLEAIVAKNDIDEKEKRLLSDKEYAKRKLDLYKQLYSEIGSTIFKFLDDGLKREEQDLDERKRLLDEDTARRINNINQLGLTEVERVKQTSAIEKQAQFDSEQIEKRKRAIEVQRAKYEKAASIASIISGTAQAVIAALKVGPPQGFVLAALTGAIGALQLAKAISTPLPKYKLGRGKGKDEYAIGGDGGIHEFIKRANGNIEMTPAVPTLIHLGAEDIVYKDQQSLMRAMLNATMRSPQVKGQNNSHGGFLELLNEQKKTTRAIAGLKLGINLKVDEKMEASAWYYKHFKN